MTIRRIVDRELASDAFAIINETIDKVIEIDQAVAIIKAKPGRTISTEAPTGIPVDGEEWIIV